MQKTGLVAAFNQENLMRILSSVLTDLGDQKLQERLVNQAMEREELLLRLGRLYRSQYDQPAASTAGPRGDLHDMLMVEARLSLAVSNEGHRQVHGDGPRAIERALRAMLDAAEPSPRPEALIVLGQSGAGKGPFVQAARRVFSRREGCVVVDVHDWIYLHPGFESLQRGSANLEHGARSWADRLFDLALGESKHIILDGCPSVPRFLELVRRLVKGSYRVNVVLLRMDRDLSWRLVQERYRFQQETMGTGRQVRKADHDVAVETARRCLAEARSNPACSDVAVVDALSYQTVRRRVFRGKRARSRSHPDVRSAQAHRDQGPNIPGSPEPPNPRHPDSLEPRAAMSVGLPPLPDEAEIGRFRRQMAWIKGALAGDSGPTEPSTPQV
jgi:Zeta toxin